jgi:hypothetical protein
MEDITESPEISKECLARIREQTLKIEKEHLHQKEARNIVPKIKEMIEEEVANS